MPEVERPRHSLRLTPELKAELMHSRKRNGRSMNAEILARLQLTFEPDPALQIAEILRPLVDSLGEGDRANLLGHVAGAVDILAKEQTKKSK